MLSFYFLALLISICVGCCIFWLIYAFSKLQLESIVRAEIDRQLHKEERPSQGACSSLTIEDVKEAFGRTHENNIGTNGLFKPSDAWLAGGLADYPKHTRFTSADLDFIADTTSTLE